MELPKLNPIPATRKTVDCFRGLNRQMRIGAGEFSQMENLTSDRFPVLSNRPGRTLYASPASPQGILAKEQLCYVDGPDLVIGETRHALGLSVQPEDCPKQLISMGAYILIFPDKCYISTLDSADRGSLDAAFTSAGEVTLSLCREDGTLLSPKFTQANAPEAVENGALWLDTSCSPGSLKQWSEASATWAAVASTWVRMDSPGIGADFSEGDAVMISGMPQALSDFNTAAVLRHVEADFLVLPGLLPETATVDTPVTIRRESPRLDFVTESGNRLWGCRFGTDAQGEPVNRIYASKLGDFKNWNCFQGLSTDSYFASVGTDGPFTGAAAYLGNPVFFKENCLHKVYGAAPAEFSIQDTACRGVQPGCHGSIALVGELMYYKSRSAVCAYDGSLPWEVSEKLGSGSYGSAAAGALGSKYYISMEGEEGWHLFVYDTARNLWHREDGFHSLGFASLAGVLYAIDGRANVIRAMAGVPSQERVRWLAQTGELGLGEAEMQYISRITLRLTLEPGASMDISAQYDLSGEWEPLAHIRGTDLRSFSIPVRPRRSDYLRLRFQGEGNVKLYAMTKTIRKGSELSR